MAKLLQAMFQREKLINSVGAGDSMVAGFIAGYLEANDIRKRI